MRAIRGRSFADCEGIADAIPGGYEARRAHIADHLPSHNLSLCFLLVLLVLLVLLDAIAGDEQELGEFYFGFLKKSRKTKR